MCFLLLLLLFESNTIGTTVRVYTNIVIDFILQRIPMKNNNLQKNASNAVRMNERAGESESSLHKIP